MIKMPERTAQEEFCQACDKRVEDCICCPECGRLCALDEGGLRCPECGQVVQKSEAVETRG